MNKTTLKILAVSVLALSGCGCFSNPEKAVLREGLWGVAEPSMKQTVEFARQLQGVGLATERDVQIWQQSYDEAKSLVEKDRANEGVRLD